ncbi:Abi-alpha family protein [Nocardia sp. NPDC050712]|uniref:Abi-alpha family protein n=1 Tax=Nocardia sp. NPDC050712 TaxID=3155518 RepID=UPI0033C1AA44
MALTESGAGDDISAAGRSTDATPSAEIARRPVTPLPVPEQPARTRPSARQTVRAGVGVARVAITAASKATAWSVGTAADVGKTVVRGSLAGSPPAEVLAEAESEFKGAVRRALGIPGATAGSAVPALHEQGAALLRLSASPHAEQPDIHPAFARMLADLTPDEARILRFLHTDGPQPALDIRTGRPRALGSDRRVSGLNLIGEHAGLRFPNRTQQYLPNLARLGLIEFAPEPVGNPHRYQLLEAEPAARTILKRSGFGTKVYYRSIVLTAFGADFIRTCLPIVVDGDRAAGTS